MKNAKLAPLTRELALALTVAADARRVELRNLDLKRPDLSMVLTASGEALGWYSLWLRGRARFENLRTAALGHFYAASRDAAHILLEDAAKRAAEAGAGFLAGPLDGDTWHPYRLTTDDCAHPPFLLDRLTPLEWSDWFMEAGFVPIADYRSTKAPTGTYADAQADAWQKRFDRGEFRLSFLDPDRYEVILEEIHALCLESFAKNFLFSPVSREEFLDLYLPLGPRLIPELVQLAYEGEKLIGFCLSLPDFSQQMRGGPMDTAILKTFARNPDPRYKGLGAWLFRNSHILAEKRGFSFLITAFMHTEKASYRLAKQIGKDIRKYALFGLPLQVRMNSRNHNILERLRTVAAEVPDKMALVRPLIRGGEESIRFSGLWHKSGNLAAFFAAHGLGPEDRALLLIKPGIDFYLLLLALTRLGVTVMLLDPGTGLAHCRACVRQIRPTAFISSPGGHIFRFVLGLGSKIPCFATGFFPGARRLPLNRPFSFDKRPGTQNHPVFAAPHDHPALITFTSGSTGRPKATIRTHGFLLRQGEVLAKLMPARSEDVELCSFPVFSLANLAQGMTTILPPPGPSLAQIPVKPTLAAIHKHKATRLLAPPHLCRSLFESDQKKILEQLRMIHTGGGPVHVNLLELMAKGAPNADIVSLYGSTEAEPVALQALSDLPEDWREKARQGQGLLAGHPVSGMEVRILRDHTGTPLPQLCRRDFENLCLGQGEAGEIVVSGDMVLKGYANPIDDAGTKIRVDDVVWHRTGDAGRLDAEGRLWLLGRCKAALEIRDERFYPFSLEAAACMWPEVRRAAHLKVKGKTVLVLEGNPLSQTQEAEIRQCGIPPDLFLYLDAIPVDSRHQSKVMYGKLEKIAGKKMLK